MAHYLILPGGPGLFDLRLDVNCIRLSINSPGHLVSYLELATSLDVEQAPASCYKTLAAGLTVEVSCGHTGLLTLHAAVADSLLGPRLRIPVGPPSMYESLVTIACADAKVTLKQLLDTSLLPSREYAAYLIPIGGKAGHHRHDTADEGAVDPSGHPSHGHAGHPHHVTEAA